MQRHVDNDLNEQETSALMDHIGQCPECAAMFSKLVQLSQGLEQLPRVAPPFSLVDAILPELDNRDASTREEAAAMSPTGGRLPHTRRFWLKRLSGLAALGAAAALLFIFNPLSSNFNSQNNQEAASMSEAAQINEGNTRLTITDQSGSLPSSADNVVEDQLPDTTVESRSSALPDVDQDAKQQPPGTASSSDSSASSANRAVNDDEKIQNRENQTEEGGGIFGFASASESEELISPDGAWRAVLTNGTLQLFRMSDGILVYEQPSEEGTRSGLAWNEDSAELHYRFVDAEGQESKRKLRVPEMIEQAE